MKAVVLIKVIDGIASGVYSSSIPNLVPPGYDDDTANKLAGLAMTSLGIGSLIAAFI